MYSDGAEWKQVFKTEQSRQNYEQVVHVVPMGPAEAKPEGAAINYDSVKQGFIYTFMHVTYARGMIITQEEIEDLLYKELAQARSQEVAMAMKRTGELVG
jgi:hypothetical protein